MLIFSQLHADELHERSEEKSLTLKCPPVNNSNVLWQHDAVVFEWIICWPTLCWQKNHELLPDNTASYFYRTAWCMRAHRISLVRLPTQSRPLKKRKNLHTTNKHTTWGSQAANKAWHQLTFLDVYTERNIGLWFLGRVSASFSFGLPVAEYAVNFGRMYIDIKYIKSHVFQLCSPKCLMRWSPLWYCRVTLRYLSTGLKTNMNCATLRAVLLQSPRINTSHKKRSTLVAK